jgi:hypothetical protein
MISDVSLFYKCPVTSARNDVSNAASGISSVTMATRDKMNMGIDHCLTCCLAKVYTHVEAIALTAFDHLTTPVISVVKAVEYQTATHVLGYEKKVAFCDWIGVTIYNHMKIVTDYLFWFPGCPLG